VLGDHLAQAPRGLSQLSFQSQVPAKQLLMLRTGNGEGFFEFRRTLLGSTDARGEVPLGASE
jgi:hypothetical protein